MQKLAAINFGMTLFLWGFQAYAQDVAEGVRPRYEGDVYTSRELLTTSRGAALANALVAGSSGTSAVWHNPAGLTSAIMYMFDADYFYDDAASGHGFEVNIADMKSNPHVGAGLGLIYEYTDPGKTEHFVQARLGIGVPLADNVISLGVSAAYSYLKHDGRQFMSQFTMDVGLVVRPVSWLSIGFAAQNLIVGNFELYMPRMISTGIAFGSLDLGLNAMFETSFNLSAQDIASTGSYGGAIEYTLKRLVPIRVGYRYEASHHVVSGGIGYRHDAGVFGLDISYQHHFKYRNDVVSASLNLYF